MLKFIKGIFDNRAEGEHRRSAFWPKLLTAFLVVQPHDRSGGPRHRLSGIREGKKTSEGVHFLSILRGNVRQGYFPVIRGGLDRVEVGLDQNENEPQRVDLEVRYP